MTTTVVTTQSELDAALADPAITTVDIQSTDGVWLTLGLTNTRAYVGDGGRADVGGGGRADVRGGGRADVGDGATVHAYGGDIRAGSHVAVHLHSGTARVEGGVLIDHTTVDQSDPATWCSYHGVRVEDGDAVKVKAASVECVREVDVTGRPPWRRPRLVPR